MEDARDMVSAIYEEEEAAVQGKRTLSGRYFSLQNC